MQRLLEYATNHQALSLLAVAAATAVLVNEMRERARDAGAISPQDAVRLMNQGVTLLDVRGNEAFAEGHIGGARNLPEYEAQTNFPDPESSWLVQIFGDNFQHLIC